jgi:predicted nucleic acid-binding protein
MTNIFVFDTNSLISAHLLSFSVARKALDIAIKADCIVTGDKDLLVLHPFREIPILTPADFLNNFGQKEVPA